LTSLKWTPTDGDLPDPLTPDLASTMMSEPTRPAATAGASARIAAVE